MPPLWRWALWRSRSPLELLLRAPAAAGEHSPLVPPPPQPASRSIGCASEPFVDDAKATAKLRELDARGYPGFVALASN